MTSRRRIPTISPSVHVERFAAGRLAGRVERDLLDARLGLAQQILATRLQHLPALIDRHRLLQWNLAFLQPLDDGFHFLDRPLEGQLLHIGIVGLGHILVPAVSSNPYLTSVGGSDDSPGYPPRRRTLTQRHF